MLLVLLFLGNRGLNRQGPAAGDAPDVCSRVVEDEELPGSVRVGAVEGRQRQVGRGRIRGEVIDAWVERPAGRVRILWNECCGVIVEGDRQVGDPGTSVTSVRHEDCRAAIW